MKPNTFLRRPISGVPVVFIIPWAIVKATIDDNE